MRFASRQPLPDRLLESRCAGHAQGQVCRTVRRGVRQPSRLLDGKRATTHWKYWRPRRRVPAGAGRADVSTTGGDAPRPGPPQPSTCHPAAHAQQAEVAHAVARRGSNPSAPPGEQARYVDDLYPRSHLNDDGVAVAMRWALELRPGDGGRDLAGRALMNRRINGSAAHRHQHPQWLLRRRTLLGAAIISRDFRPVEVGSAPQRLHRQTRCAHYSAPWAPPRIYRATFSREAHPLERSQLATTVTPRPPVSEPLCEVGRWTDQLRDPRRPRPRPMGLLRRRARVAEATSTCRGGADDPGRQASVAVCGPSRAEAEVGRCGGPGWPRSPLAWRPRRRSRRRPPTSPAAPVPVTGPSRARLGRLHRPSRRPDGRVPLRGRLSPGPIGRGGAAVVAAGTGAPLPAALRDEGPRGLALLPDEAARPVPHRQLRGGLGWSPHHRGRQGPTTTGRLCYPHVDVDLRSHDVQG